MVKTAPMTNLRANPDGARLRFFTSGEVAGMLKMNSQVIARKLQAGELEGYKLGKDWRVSESQLLDFLERHRGPRLKKIVKSRNSPRS
jgi:excisionase family DNA binding protein